MRVALLTREYPPDVYGGGGVHVEYLARELERLEQLTVHCWGEEREQAGVVRHRAWDALTGAAPHLAALRAMSVDLAMAAAVEGSVLMPGVQVGREAVVRNAIIDKNVVIAPGAQVGVDVEADRERFTVSDGGVVVIGKGERVEA